MGSAQTAMIRLARAVPGPARWLNTRITGPVMRRFPVLALQILSEGSPESDRQVLADPEIRGRLLASIREAFRQGGRGPLHQTDGPGRIADRGVCRLVHAARSQR